MSDMLWFLLGVSISTNFFLIWKLTEVSEAFEELMLDVAPEEKKTDG